MFALIVNAFRADEKGKRKFADFETAVTTALGTLGEKCSVQSRRYDDLDPFLFLPDEGFRQDYAAKQFDKVDMIFIDGDDNFLPWDPRLDQVRILMKMCLMTNKCTFACTFANHMFVYILSTGAPRLQLADDMVRGSTIAQLRTKYVADPVGLHGSHFVDHHSGDLYQFDIDVDPQGVWVPIMNVGLTLRRAMGKKNKEILRPDPLNADWFDSNVEIPIRIQSQHIQHWLFANVSKQQFMTTWKNDWDIAPAMVAPVNGAFTVLADNSRAAQIIERGNIVGVEFHMQTLFADTLVPLRNFIAHQNERMQATGTLHSSAYSLRAEIGILIRTNMLAYTAQFFSNRFMRGTQKSAPRVSEASGTAQSIQPPRALDSALARRTTQASLALAVRPPETVRPFTQPFAATRANGASLLSPTVRSASAAGLHTTTLGQSAAVTARFGKLATGSRARVSDADTLGELDIQQNTRFSLPGSQSAPEYHIRGRSPASRLSNRRPESPFLSSLNTFESLSASAAQVAASLIPASAYFPDDPAARIDWSSWQNHLPASGLPSLGALKPEIRRFLHPDRDDDDVPPPSEDADATALAEAAAARAKRAEVVAKWPLGLESTHAVPLQRVETKPAKPFSAHRKHEQLAQTLNAQQADTKAHSLFGATMQAERDARRDAMIHAQKERAFTAQATRRTRYMLDGQRDKVTGAGKHELMSTLGLTAPFSPAPLEPGKAAMATLKLRPATVSASSHAPLDSGRSDHLSTPRFPGDTLWLSAVKKGK